MAFGQGARHSRVSRSREPAGAADAVRDHLDASRAGLGWFGLEREGVVAFRNGQHRARYLADAGARWFPVEVHEREATLLRELCGAADDARTVVRATPLNTGGGT
jgi:hypothetical protein